MKHFDPISAADRAEEAASLAALKEAKTPAELVSVWSLSCEHFDGAARERLQDAYRDRLRQLGALAP